MLLDQSEGWQEVREPGLAKGYPDFDHQTFEKKRTVMTEQKWNRIPEGEPSVKSVLAALRLAREDAMAREEAVRRGEPVVPPHHGPWEGYRVDMESREEAD